MYYLSEHSIAKAWHNLIKIENIPNKFFGLLEMMRVLNIDAPDKVKPQQQYTFSASRLAIALQHRFTFETNRDFKSKEKYWVIFAKDWKDVVLKDFFGNVPPNVLDVAIICFQNQEFESYLTIDELLEKFYQEYHLGSLDEQPNFFCREDYMLEWRESKLIRQELKETLFNKLSLDKSSPTLGFEFPPTIASNAGELARAPFFQTLYSSQSAMKCLICTKFDLFSQYRFNNFEDGNRSNLHNSTQFKLFADRNLTPKQKIYFGSPGTGKSTAMQKFAKDNDLEVIRTTFHPDTDYHSFVGGYKPVMKDDKITYQFVAQAFTKAYVKAYQNPDKNYLLAIEEINRGNCAQIFGDLFQCLDRKEDGYSCYPIDANADLANYLASQGLENSEELILPPNLLIYATMNTSDQSLFPMDSAFKRRWDWQYVPIEFNEKANEIKIVFDNETQYSWRSFIENVNKKIKEITKSEDKKIGVYFVSVDDNNTISLAQFQNKVMFYLWSEIFKDEHQSADNIFKYLNQNDNLLDFTFNELFENEGLVKLKSFMKYLKIPIQ